MTACSSPFVGGWWAHKTQGFDTENIKADMWFGLGKKSILVKVRQVNGFNEKVKQVKMSCLMVLVKLPYCEPEVTA